MASRKAITATAPCPVCGGALTVRRCKTAHRRYLICDCGQRRPLPETLKLRLAGAPELPLFETNEER